MRKRFLFIVPVCLLAGFLSIGFIRRPATTSAMRGYEIALETGCFACHRPMGARGVSDPDSVMGEVPLFNAGGPLMFYIQNDDEIREWILYGRPHRLEKQGSQKKGLIRMPAFSKVFSGKQVDHLVAYVKSVAFPEKPFPYDAAKGREIAQRLGCFGCHGPEGRTGFPNPGSFKGIIPPWEGKDFAELVTNDEELKEWILEGKIRRFESNPLARFFTNRQTIKMPPFRNILKNGELERLVAYIKWLQDPGRIVTQQHWIDPEASLHNSLIARGRWLYQASGCVTCHDSAGEGETPNGNSLEKFVPSLNDIGEKIGLHTEEEVRTILSVMESGLLLESLREKPPIPRFETFLSRYQKMFRVIVRGSRPLKKDVIGEDPPLQMPAWKNRMHGDEGPLSRGDIDALIAYILTFHQGEESKVGEL